MGHQIICKAVQVIYLGSNWVKGDVKGSKGGRGGVLGGPRGFCGSHGVIRLV